MIPGSLSFRRLPPLRFRALLPAAILAALLAAPLPAPALSAPLSESESSRLIALSLLPASVDLLVWVDYAAVRRSDLVSEMETRIDALPEAAENYRRFVEATGLDPRKDTDQVLLSFRKTNGSDSEGFLLVARGRFTGAKLVDAAAAKGGTVTTTDRGVKIWTSRGKPGAAGDPGAQPEVSLAQPDAATLLFGGEKEVERAAHVAIRAKSPAAREVHLRELISSIDTTAPLWAILDSPSLAREVSSGIARGEDEDKTSDLLTKVSSVRMTAWVGKDLDLKIQAEARDPETAGQLGDLFRGMVAAGKLAAKDDDPELLKILQEMAVTESGKEVEVKAKIPGSRLLAARKSSAAD
jgi:hypothetical protein